MGVFDRGWWRSLVAAVGLCSLGACAPAPAPGTASTVVVADSIGFGIGDGPNRGFGFNGPLGSALAGAELFVGGPGEGPIGDGWADRVAAVGPTKTLVLQACCNGFTTERSWRAALLDVVAASGASQVVVVTTPVPAAGTWFGHLAPTVATANEVLRALARQKGFELADLAAAWPPGTPGVRQPDGLHLTDVAAAVAGQFIAERAR